MVKPTIFSMSYLVFFDLDETLIREQSQKLLVSYLFKKHKINFLFLIYIYLWFLFYKLHLIKDVIKIRKRAFLICKRWRVEDTNVLLRDFVNTIILPNIYNEALREINNHKKNNAIIVLLSSSLLPLVEIIKESLNLDYVIATSLEVSGDIYTGKIEKNVIYGREKTVAAKKFIENHNFTLNNSYAYTDHFSDLDLLKLVDHPIIVNPDKKLFKVAIINNWPVINFVL